jgi:hypothetical protein
MVMKKIIFSAVFLSLVIISQAQTSKTDVLQKLEKTSPKEQETSVSATTTTATRLFGEKDDLTTVIQIIPVGSAVTVLGSDSTYLHVVFEEIDGYIFKRHAVIDNAQVAKSKTDQISKFVEAEPPVQAQQESHFTYLENKYGTSMATRISAGKIWKGMNSEMVKDSWGRADKITRVIDGNKIKEEWIYRNTWLYFENNSLVEWGPRKN